MTLQQCSGFLEGALAVTPDLAQLDDFEGGELVSDDVTKAHFPFFVASVGERAGEQRDLTLRLSAEKNVRAGILRAFRPRDCRCRYSRARYVQDVDTSVTIGTPDEASERIASLTVGWSKAITPTPMVSPSIPEGCRRAYRDSNPSMGGRGTSRSGLAVPWLCNCRRRLAMKVLVPAAATSRGRRALTAEALCAAGLR